VRGRVPEIAPTTLAGDHDGTHGRQSSQHARCLLDQTELERLAHPRGARAPLGASALARAHVVDEHDLEAVLCAQIAQHRSIASPLAAETEIAPREHEARFQSIHEHPLHEVVGFEVGELLVEGQHEGRVDAGCRQQFALLRVAHEGGRAERGRKQRQRMPVEGHDGRRQTAFGGMLLQQCEHGTVPGVHAVELADRDGTRPEAGRHGVDPGEELHQCPIAARARERNHAIPSTGSASGTKRYPAPKTLHTVASRPNGLTDSRPSTCGANTESAPTSSTPASSKLTVTQASLSHPAASATVASTYTTAATAERLNAMGASSKRSMIWKVDRPTAAI